MRTRGEVLVRKCGCMLREWTRIMIQPCHHWGGQRASQRADSHHDRMAGSQAGAERERERVGTVTVWCTRSMEARMRARAFGERRGCWTGDGQSKGATYSVSLARSPFRGPGLFTLAVAFL